LVVVVVVMVMMVAVVVAVVGCDITASREVVGQSAR
jgi:hypothetical protein